MGFQPTEPHCPSFASKKKQLSKSLLRLHVEEARGRGSISLGKALLLPPPGGQTKLRRSTGLLQDTETPLLDLTDEKETCRPRVRVVVSAPAQNLAKCRPLAQTWFKHEGYAECSSD